MSKLILGCENGCIEWRAQLDAYGYAMIWDNNRHKSIRASRASHELFKGPIPKGQLIMHLCDNPKCVNPSHLIAGTHQDNATDMVSKGRQPKGEQKPLAKLTWDKVRQIRDLYTRGGYTHDHLAEIYNVSDTTIQHILTNKVWNDSIS